MAVNRYTPVESPGLATADHGKDVEAQRNEVGERQEGDLGMRRDAKQ